MSFRRNIPESELEELKRLFKGKGWFVEADTMGKIISIKTRNNSIKTWIRNKNIPEV